MERRFCLGSRCLRVLMGFAMVAAISVLSPAPAVADTVTPPPAEIPPTDIDFTQTIGVDQFDPALGTLNSVTVELTATATGMMGVENTSPDMGSTGTIELSAQVEVSLAVDPSLAVTMASPACLGNTARCGNAWLGDVPSGVVCSVALGDRCAGFRRRHCLRRIGTDPTST